MQAPSLHDYVRSYFTLFERFEQEQQSSGFSNKSDNEEKRGWTEGSRQKRWVGREKLVKKMGKEACVAQQVAE